MKPIRLHRAALLLTAAAALGACQSPQLRYVIKDKLNPDPSDVATELAVMPFFFKGDGKASFENEGYEALKQEFENSSSPEGRKRGTMLFIPVPGERVPGDGTGLDLTAKPAGTLTISVPDGDFTWLGLVGNFYEKTDQQWRLAVPLSELGNHELIIAGHAFAEWRQR
jgi:hypothetical protein